jgi:DNA-binding transcriptional LysR family regulator
VYFVKSDRGAMTSDTDALLLRQPDRAAVNGHACRSLAVRDGLCAGFGLSLIPWAYVRNDIEQGRLRTVPNDWSTVETSVYVVYPSRRYVTAKVRAFIEFLVEELGSESIQIQGLSG